jgi:c-di-GMP-binding flagellar brake protein YcgR
MSGSGTPKTKAIMKESGDGGEQKFVPTKSSETRVLIQIAVNTGAKVQIWTAEQRHKLVSKIQSTFESGDFLYLSLFQDQEEAAFEFKLKQEGIESCLFSVTLPSDVIFFQAEFKRSHRGFMHFKIIEPVYKVQRRKSLRMPLNDVLLQFSGPSGEALSAKILDISDGGLGLLIEDDKTAALLSKGMILEQVEFKLGNHAFKFSAEIAYHRQVASTGKLRKHFKLGLRFTNISENDASTITGFILEESSRFFGRL